MTLPTPRNAVAILAMRKAGTLKRGDTVVASFVGSTTFSEPHVFCDSGKRYDWSLLSGLQLAIVVKPGVDAEHAMRAALELTEPYPTLVDVERQIVGSIVHRVGGGMQLWQRRRGSEVWAGIFT